MGFARRPLFQEDRQSRPLELKHGPGPEEIPMRRDRRLGLVRPHFRTQTPRAVALSPPQRRVDIVALAIDDNPSTPTAELGEAREVLLDYSVALAKVLLFLCGRKGGFEIEGEADPRRVFRKGETVQFHPCDDLDFQRADRSVQRACAEPARSSKIML